MESEAGQGEGGCRVVVPYVNLHPLVMGALYRLAPEADLISLGTGEKRYHELLAMLWREGRSFLLIEQDIEIHDSVLPEMETCPEPWCLFPFLGAISEGPIENFLLKLSLGCTRFRSDLMRSHPSFFDDFSNRQWNLLDVQVYRRLEGLGYTPHLHWPHVSHHHVYNGRCSCQREHKAYPVDRSGRYCP